MRKPVLAGSCFALLLLVTSTYSLENVPKTDEADAEGSWLPSASDILHRVKRQFFFWGSRSTTTAAPSAATESPGFNIFPNIFGLKRDEDKTTESPTTSTVKSVERNDRYTRSTVKESVTPSIPTDDEDMGQSGSGTDGASETTWEPENRQPRYYRISLIVMEPYKPDYEDTSSTLFRFLAQSLTKSINELYTSIPGEQLSRVIKIQKAGVFNLRVFLDIHSIGNHNSYQIKQLLKDHIGKYQRIGIYVLENNMTFNEFGVCENDEIACRDNTDCFLQNARCDGNFDCADESDEIGCESVVTSTVPSVSREIEECGRGEFICDLTRCILASQKCDGTRDCDDGTDEADCTKPGCDFRCRDGTCLSYPQRCNIVKDCLPDGEDELGCHRAGARCPPGDFECRNGDCINIAYKCDAVSDCPDNSDEEDCPASGGYNTTFRPPQPSKPCDGFTCDDSSCVESQHRCDGKIDCNDGSDENGCINVPKPTAQMCLPGQRQCHDSHGCYFLNQTCDGHWDCSDGTDEYNCDCRSDEFKCVTGECIPIGRKCNGYNDCSNGEDEQGCTRDCGSGQFRCDDGACINSNMVCDNYHDCSDGEDEAECHTDPEMPKCLDTEFRCKDNKCIQLDYRCDGLQDCSDKSDEEDCEDYCGPKDHKCDNGTCIKPSKVCDNYVDCKDGSDEQGCFPECSWSEFKCDSGECIPNVDKCNQLYDCRDGSDEQNCLTTVECNSFQFKCLAGDQCVHRSLQCDGRSDCRDRSDEWNCAPRNSSSSGDRCGPGEFRCLSGNQCISHSKFCDGHSDCNDWSDEENCAAGPTLDLKTYPPEQTIKESREVVFQCRDEGPGHIPVRWSRDGLPMPPNTRDHRGRLEIPNIQLSHSGTYFCEAQGVPKNSPGAKVAVFLRVEPFTVPTPFTPVCRPDEATCHNRECIPKHKVCDGVHDCGDGSDESRCSPWGCEPNEFACDNKKCVRKSWVCDKDDDCGDGSDEKNCQQKPTGSICYVNEFECADRKMCIPKWFHCDSHNDCHDGSDEIGCFPITIVEPPKPMVILSVGETLVLHCRATGVPTPIISWRLNWHHVPAKCRSTSENGVGRLTCSNMQEMDQGAYTCEALDFRNSMLAPDTHVVVKPTGSVSCSAGTYNAGTGSDECIPCFCFGATTDCHSSDQLYKSVMRPAMQVARFINVRYDPYRQIVEVRANDPSIIPQSAARVLQDNVIQIVTPLSTGRRYDQIYPYLALPEVLHGDQLKSYGGSIRYKVQFGGSSSHFTRTTTPDLILMGNGYTLAYNVTDRLIPQSENEISIQFVPGNWRVVDKPQRNTDYGSGYATREDLMMALQNVENILVNFQYLEGEQAETTISDIRMDTASLHNTGGGVAVAVEHCRCPAGYKGQSCERCDDGYMRSSDGLWLGRCESYTPPECPPGTYGDLSRRIPCSPCPCPLTNSQNQFGLKCRLDADDNPTCDCPAGYVGRRCEACASGYTGNPMEPNGYCRPQEDECDLAGSYSTRADPYTGQCDCKAHTMGQRCDQCKPDTFALNSRNQHGCIDCFCMGITEECTSSSLYRDQIKSVFNSGSHGFTIAANDDFSNARNVSFDSGRWEIMYNNFEPKVYYWVLPNRFLGDKVTSYGGDLKYTLRYVPTPGGQSSRNNAPDVEIRSLNNINIVHRSQTPPEPGVESTITVPILEQHWTREDGGPVDRPHLLMALADLSAIYIKATYTTNTLEAGLMSVSLETADSRNTGSWDRASEVEQCKCPPGYIGTSCEDCDAGYTRTEDGLYLRFCEPCSCNNHSTRCHPETGVCEDCGDNTFGPRCEHCLPGFIRGSDNSCRPDGQPCECDSRGSSGPCTGRYCQCKVNVVGARCDRCRSGTFGLTDSRPEGCFECYCSGLTSQCQSSNLYREKIPTLVIDDMHGFTLLEMPYSRSTSLSEGRTIHEGFNLDYSRNEVGFDVSRRSNRRFFWSLPSQLTGDKVTSYGGKLSFKLRYSGNQELIQLEPDTHVILVGNGINLFRHFNDDIIQANYPKHFEVDLIDDSHWKIMNPTTSKTEASRIDMLKTLSSLEKILILATFGEEIEMTHISDVAMDTAVPARFGQEATEIEVCRCPPEYKGSSCQQCNDHYYRNYDQSCRRCPCSDNEESCSLTSDNQVKCHCLPGFYGQQCELRDNITTPPTVPPGRPTIIIRIPEPTIKIVAVGSTVRYNCSAISQLPGRRVTVAWSKEGGILPSRAIKDDGLLIIPEVRESDSGVYICTASDGYGSQSQAVTLTVGGGPGRRPVVRISPDFVEARIGDQLEISCESSGTPRPSISWSKQDGSPISSYSAQHEGLLRIDSLRRSDEGYYECEASNSYGSDRATAEVRLTDRDRDGSVNISPTGFSGLEGDNVYMTCTTPRNNTRLTWSRANGRSLPQTARESNGTLVFYGVRSADQGVYICTAYDISTSRKVTEAQAIINIGTIRPPPPVVTIEPDKQTVPQGNLAMIRCSTTQPGVSIRWSKREDTIPPHVQIQGGTLRIPSAHVTDRGMYICTAEYESGQLQKYAILEIEPREVPTIELYPRTQQTLVTGASMLFQCRASGIPPPNVYWTRPGNKSIAYNIQQLPNGVLRMNSVQVSDAGQYVCHAENTAGSTTATANIEVHSTPVIRISPKGPVQLQVGQILKLECNATGYPRPYVSWSRHRSSPRTHGYGYPGLTDDLSSPSYDNALYEAYSVTREDEGLYLCNARNDAGTTEERIEVIVNDNSVPRPFGPDDEDNFGSSEDDNDQSITIMGGESMHITCHLLQGAPSDRVSMKWSRSDNLPLPEGSHQRDGVLYLNNVNKDFEGVYTCMLIDRDTNAVLKQKHTTVTVNYPPRITLVPPKQVVRVGENAKILCKAYGEDPITISWEAIKRPMPTSVSTQQGYLMFQGITTNDAGRYICKAKNLMAESSAVAEVIVNSDTTFIPIVKAIDRSLTVYEGSKVELQCSADATIQVKWDKESGSSCCDLPHQAMVSGNTLLLEYADMDDSGRYVCTGVSPSGASSSDYIDLTVIRARNPKLTIVPSIDVVKVGGNIDLTCQPSGIPNSQLSWTKVSDKLGNNVRVLDNVLRITDVTTNNNGMYMCSARISTGLYEAKYILDVRDDDDHSTTGNGNNNDYNNNNGDGDNYDNYDDNDNNGYGNGVDNNNHNNGNNNVHNNGHENDLEYHNGDHNNNNGYDNNHENNEYDNGVVDNNEYNNGNNNNEYDHPYNDPALEVKSADAGKTMTLTCKTDLEPPVEYSWSKLGQEFPPNAYANRSTLILSNLNDKDAGLYICLAHNGDVRMEIPMIVTVTGLIPSFHQKPISYVTMPMLLDAHLTFDIEITFKPEQPDGLILYNGQSKKDGDFISFGLKSGRPEFRFEVGSGPAVISTNRPIRLNQWHTVKLTRNKKQGEMIVDGEGPYKGSSPGRYQGLDLDQPMYLGSVPEFDKINPMNGFSSGFVGCISELKIGGIDKPVTREYALEWVGVGDCETCGGHVCQNGGACQQARNNRGYICLCPKSFSDLNCTKRGESCFTGACGTGECVEAERGIRCKCPIDKTGDRCENHQTIKTPQFSSNSYIAYRLLKSQQKMKMTVMFKAADDSDGILLYTSPKDSNHFVSLAIKNKRLHYLFDNGYGATLIRSDYDISPGEWEVATIGADESEIYLNFHEYHRSPHEKKSGSQRSAVGELLYLGGVDPSVRIHQYVGVRKGFSGCVSSIEVHGQSLNVVWSAQEASDITECTARESASSISCRPNTCKNNGVCSIKNNRVSCTCRPGYSGFYCDKIEDECITSSPCMNGGTCEKTSDGDVQCLCPSGIAGDKCEHRLEEDISFNGNGYLELPADMMQHDDPSESEVIEIEFTTTSSDGLLLWQGNTRDNREESDFLAIAVVGGHLEVSYELGSGPARIRVSDGPMVDDGRRHKVAFTRTGMDGEVTVDSHHEASGSSQGHLARLNTPGNIYIGGAPDIQQTTSSQYTRGFSGCIHRLRLPYQGDVDLITLPLRTLNALPCSNQNDINEDDEGPTRGDTSRRTSGPFFSLG